MEIKEFRELLLKHRTETIHKIQNHYDMDAHTQSFGCSMVQRICKQISKKLDEIEGIQNEEDRQSI